MACDDYLTDFCRDFCKDFPCERDVIKRRKNASKLEKCDDKVSRVNEKWQKRLAKLEDDNRKLVKDTDANRTEINRLNKIIKCYEDEKILLDEKYERCENSMYTYKKLLAEEQNKSKYYEETKVNELELEARISDKEKNNLQDIIKAQHSKILQLETDYKTKSNVTENYLKELNEIKTNYRNLENELQENKVGCSKAMNNYQALEIEIQLLRKRLDDVPKLKKKIEELNREKNKVREMSRERRTELIKCKEEAMNLQTNLEDCEKRKVKYIFTGEHLGQVKKKLRACEKDKKRLMDKFNKEGHPILNICNKKFLDIKNDKVLQNIKCIYDDKNRDVKVHRLRKIIKRLKQVVEQKDKELKDMKNDTLRAEFTEKLHEEEIKKVEAALTDVSKEVLFASNVAKLNALKVKQTKAEAGLTNTQLGVERAERKLQELKTMKAQEENRLIKTEIKKSRFTIKKLEKDKKECSDLNDEYKRRIAGLAEDMKFDDNFEAGHQKKMANINQVVEKLQNMVFKHEETINMAKHQENVLVDRNRQLEENLVESKRNFKADLEKSNEEIARLKAEKAFYQTGCKQFAHYKKMACTYRNRLMMENSKEDRCREKLLEYREKELLREDKIYFDDKALMEEICGGCRIRAEEIRHLTETSRTMVLQMIGLKTRLKELEMANKEAWK